jgi:hypothetical protein
MRSDVLDSFFNILLHSLSSRDIGLSDLASSLSMKIIVVFPNKITALVMKCDQYVTESVIFSRYLKVLAKVIGVSNHLFDECFTQGAVRIVIDSCKSSDILMQMVIMEDLVEFANTTSGLRYLFQDSVMQWLVNCCSEKYGMDALMSSQALRQLSNIFARASERKTIQEIVNESIFDLSFIDSFLSATLYHLNSNDEERQLAGIATLSFVNIVPYQLRWCRIRFHFIL